MADYSRLRLVYEKSTASDYSKPDSHYVSDEFTPTQHLVERVISAAVAGTTIDLGHLTSMSVVVINNLDTTNFVSVGWTDTAANANTQKLPAGTVMVIPDLDPTAADLVLTADTGACLCAVSYGGT